MPTVTQAYFHKDRFLCFCGMLLGAAVFGGHLWWIGQSGQIVGSVELPLQHQAGIDGVLEAYRQNSPLIGKALDTRWLESKPLRLAPEMGVVTLTLREVESGLVKRDERRSRAEYILLNARDRSELLHQKTHWENRHSSKSELKTSPTVLNNFTIGERKNRYGIGKVTVPAAGDYVLLLGVDEWFLASSGQTLTLVAESGKLEADPVYLAAGIGIIFLSAVAMAWTVRKTDDSQHWKIKQ